MPRSTTDWPRQTMHSAGCARVWNNKHLKKGTKMSKNSVYIVVLLTTLLYDSESWVTYRHHVRLLERFHKRCLHSILNIRGSDFVTPVEILEKTEVSSIEVTLMKSQPRWAGHVSRMQDHRLPKNSLLATATEGHQRNDF